VAVIAEGVPISDARKLIAQAKKLGKVIIGPATVGGIQAGAFKLGREQENLLEFYFLKNCHFNQFFSSDCLADAAGTIENIIACKLYRPGCVGFISKSGGLSNECYNILSRTTNGLFEVNSDFQI
jgi:ATP citrate (pro-S)-lyase